MWNGENLPHPPLGPGEQPPRGKDIAIMAVIVLLALAAFVGILSMARDVEKPGAYHGRKTP